MILGEEILCMVFSFQIQWLKLADVFQVMCIPPRQLQVTMLHNGQFIFTVCGTGDRLVRFVAVSHSRGGRQN